MRHPGCCGGAGVPATGSCLCGAVRFEVAGELRHVVNCHCRQCRKWSGHYVAATAAWQKDFALDDPGAALKWYRSSPSARRGFCRKCGTSLFWQRDGADTISIMAGALEGDTGLRTRAQIYIDDKGDYYGLSDPQAPLFARSGHDVRLGARAALDEGA
jgi:hypothetical protein